VKSAVTWDEVDENGERFNVTRIQPEKRR